MFVLKRREHWYPSESFCGFFLNGPSWYKKEGLRERRWNSMLKLLKMHSMLWDMFILKTNLVRCKQIIFVATCPITTKVPNEHVMIYWNEQFTHEQHADGGSWFSLLHHTSASASGFADMEWINACHYGLACPTPLCVVTGITFSSSRELHCPTGHNESGMQSLLNTYQTIWNKM